MAMRLVGFAKVKAVGKAFGILKGNTRKKRTKGQSLIILFLQ